MTALHFYYTSYFVKNKQMRYSLVYLYIICGQSHASCCPVSSHSAKLLSYLVHRHESGINLTI